MTGSIGPDRIFALTHVPVPVRDAVSAVWELDARLGTFVATTTQPLVGQVRLTWWHQALSGLKHGVSSPEPLLDKLARQVVGRVTDGPEALAALVEGWEALLDPVPLSDGALQLHAKLRGAQLFAISGQLLGERDVNLSAGEGWALADFALRCSDSDTRARAFAMACDRFGDPGKLPRPLRVLARLAEGDVRAGKYRKRTLFRLLTVAR